MSFPITIPTSQPDDSNRPLVVILDLALVANRLLVLSTNWRVRVDVAVSVHGTTTVYRWRRDRNLQDVQLVAIMDFPRATAMDPGVIMGRLVNPGVTQDNLRWLTFSDIYTITDPWADPYESIMEPDWSQRTFEDGTLAISRYRRQLPPPFMRATGEFDYEGDWLRNVLEFEIIRSRHIPDSVIDGEFALAVTVAIQVERDTPVLRDARQRINLMLWKRQARVEALARETI